MIEDAGSPHKPPKEPYSYSAHLRMRRVLSKAFRGSERFLFSAINAGAGTSVTACLTQRVGHGLEAEAKDKVVGWQGE